MYLLPEIKFSLRDMNFVGNYCYHLRTLGDNFVTTKIFSGLPDDIVYWTSGTDAASEGNFVWETTGLPVKSIYVSLNEFYFMGN